MISIIISTYRSDYLESFKKNVAATIGIEYEIIAIDNSNAQKGLCEVYNLGTRKAIYPIVCYAHDDIEIKAENWGYKVSELFMANKQLGLLGIAGSDYKPVIPSGWSFLSANHHTTYINVLQSDKKSSESFLAYNNPKNVSLAKVVTIDGLWFCTKKEIALQCPFDENTFKKFHCYDIDFSLSVYQKYEVAVTFDILIEHFSHGSFNRDWIGETFKLHKKWMTKLPVNLGGITKQQQVREERKAFDSLLADMVRNNYIHRDIFSYLWNKRVRSIFPVRTFTKINLILISTILKRLVTNKG